MPKPVSYDRSKFRVLFKTILFASLCGVIFAVAFYIIDSRTPINTVGYLWPISAFEGAIFIGLLIYAISIANNKKKDRLTNETYHQQVIHLLNLIRNNTVPKMVLRSQFVFAEIPKREWVETSHYFLRQLSEDQSKTLIDNLNETHFFDEVQLYLKTESIEKFKIPAILLLGYDNTTSSIPTLVRFCESENKVERLAAILALSIDPIDDTFYRLQETLLNTPDISWMIVAYVFSKFTPKLMENCKALLNDPENRVVTAVLAALPLPLVINQQDRIQSLLWAKVSPRISRLAISRIIEANITLPNQLVTQELANSGSELLLPLLVYVQTHPDVLFLTPLIKRLNKAVPGYRLPIFETLSSYGHVGLELLKQSAQSSDESLNTDIRVFLKDSHA